MVHQHFSLVPHMTVVENLMLGPAAAACSSREEFARTHPRADRGVSASTLDLDRPRRRPLGRRAPARRDRQVPDARSAAARARRADRGAAARARSARSSTSAVASPPAAAASFSSPTSWPRSPSVADRATVLRARPGRRERRDGAGPTCARWSDAMVGRDIVSLDAAGGDARRRGRRRGGGGRARQRDRARRRRRGRSPEDALVSTACRCGTRQGATRLDDFTLDRQAAARSSAWPASRATARASSALVLAGLRGRPTGASSSAARNSPADRPAEITAAGVGIVPEDRHAVACITGMSVAENLFLGRLDRFTRFGLLRRRALTAAAAELMRALRRARAPARRRRSASCRAATSRRPCSRASCRSSRWSSCSPPSRRAASTSARSSAVYGQIRAARARGVGVLLISSELDELIAVADRIARPLSRPHRRRDGGEHRATARPSAPSCRGTPREPRRRWPPCRDAPPITVVLPIAATAVVGLLIGARPAVAATGGLGRLTPSRPSGTGWLRLARSRSAPRSTARWR